MNRYAAIAVVLAAAVASPVYAQLGNGTVITAPGSVTQDATVEANSGTTALSVTTGLNAGWYTLNGPQIGNWDTALFSGVNDQNFFQNFPGWQPLPANSTNEARRLTNVLQNTYGGALMSAHAQSQELENEDFSNIEATSTGTPNLLTAMQANTEAQLQVARELQFVRQLLITLVTVNATKAAADLNDKARLAATSATSMMPGG